MNVGHSLSICLTIGVFAPLVMFLILAFFGVRLGKPRASVPAIAGIVISLALSSYVLVRWQSLSPEARTAAAAGAIDYHWATLGDIEMHAGVKLDSLTVCMYFMVTLVSSCIFAFSRGYMSGHSDEVDHVSKYHRFFAYLSLFAFSMLGLVISSSLVFLFIFWELVGVCSYLLIGFYFDRKYASNAAMKAFIVNRVGDFGFMIGLALVVLFLKDVSIDGAAAAFGAQHGGGSGLFAAKLNVFGWTLPGYCVATMMGVALFCGCIGKSAQVPLQVWLPDAMAGPTPVSALIHAATMVAAGVYLVARIYPLLTPDAQYFIAVIGCITLTMAALIAIVQTDIKKVLAYSTLSQLGYMVFGMGVGAWVGALFHLITHAFFKAMLFLGSGQVIEGCHHEQDIRKMGGLRHKMPVTCWTFFIGVLAISGFGLPALNTTILTGVGGYYSKDEVLAVAYYRAYGSEAGHESGESGEGHGGLERLPGSTAQLAGMGPTATSGHTAGTAVARAVDSKGMPALPKWMIWLSFITAYVTPFYMMRVWWLTFMGQPRDHHVHEHAHEIPWMKWPLVVLAVGTFLSSWFMFRPMIANAAEGVEAVTPLVATFDGHDHEVHHFSGGPLTLLIWPSFIVGFVIAFAIYRHGLGIAQWIARLPVVGVVYNILVHKYYFDEVYDTVLVGGTRVLARISGFIDKWLLDFSIIENLARLTKGLAFFSGDWLDARGVDKAAEGLGRGAMGLGDVFRRAQTGRIRDYVIFSATSALIVVLALILL